MPVSDRVVGEAPHRSVAEETANSLTHGFGLLLSLLAGGAVSWAAPHLGVGTLISCAVFIATLVALYAISTASHLVERSERQNLLRSWDQGAVYLLIAGTYTPFVWAALGPPGRELGMAALWLAAAAGFVSKVVARHRVNSMKTKSYLLLGWIPAIFLFRSVPVATLGWMAAGGVSYTIGTLFLRADMRVRYFHAAWHLFVVLGSACHFHAIYQWLIAPEIVR